MPVHLRRDKIIGATRFERDGDLADHEGKTECVVIFGEHGPVTQAKTVSEVLDNLRDQGLTSINSYCRSMERPWCYRYDRRLSLRCSVNPTVRAHSIYQNGSSISADTSYGPSAARPQCDFSRNAVCKDCRYRIRWRVVDPVCKPRNPRSHQPSHESWTASRSPWVTLTADDSETIVSAPIELL